MTAKEYLEQLIVLDKEINSKQQRLITLRDIVVNTTPTYEEESVQHSRKRNPLEDIMAKIVDLDLENKKISLSMKALLPKPERRQNNRGRRNREDENVDEAYVDIDAYIRKMDADAKRAEEKAAAEAAKEAEAAVEEAPIEEAAAALDAKVAEAQEVAEAVTEEVKDAE